VGAGWTASVGTATIGASSVFTVEAAGAHALRSMLRMINKANKAGVFLFIFLLLKF
jgi:hypothetical protein